MNNQPLEFVYTTQRIATLLNIGRSTVNRYCRSLEIAGYEFVKDDNKHRAFTDHDLAAFRALIELLDRGMIYENAIQLVNTRYNRSLPSSSVSVSLADSAHQFSDPGRQEITMLNQKMDEVMIAISQLSSRLDQVIDERVKSEVSAAAEQLKDQVQDIARQVQISQEKTDQKLEEVLSRFEKHGKRKKLLGIF